MIGTLKGYDGWNFTLREYLSDVSSAIYDRANSDIK